MPGAPRPILAMTDLRPLHLTNSFSSSSLGPRTAGSINIFFSCSVVVDPPLAGVSHPSVLDLGHGGCSRCCGTKSAQCRTPGAPQLTRSQVSTKQTTDRSRSWHRHVWKCWAGCSVVIQGPAWGGCRQTTVGSQMLMVAGLLLAWAGTNLPARPIRKTSEEGSAKYHLQLSLDTLSELK